MSVSVLPQTENTDSVMETEGGAGTAWGGHAVSPAAHLL